MLVAVSSLGIASVVRHVAAPLTVPGRIHARFSFSYGGRMAVARGGHDVGDARSAQAKTDEDYDKLMKAVGAANGAMRGAAKEQNAAGVAAEAAKMVALFKDAQAFWTARNNTEAAEWAGAAMTHAAAIDEGATRHDMAAMGAHEGARRHVPDLPHEVSREDRDGLRDQEE